MDDIKKLIKNFSGAAFWNILGQGVNFLTLLFLPRVLGPNGYGVFSFAQSYLMYFLLIGDLGLSLYCIKSINQIDENDKMKMIDSIFSLRLILSIISTIIFCSSLLFLNLNSIEKYTLIGVGISIVFTGITVDYIFNALNKVKYIGIAAAIKNTIFFVLCILFIKSQKDVVMAATFYSIGIIIAAALLLLRFNKTEFKLKIVKLKECDFKLLKCSIPLAVSIFMVQINNNFDVIYLSFTKSELEVGYYSAAYKIINFIIAIMCLYLNSAYPTIAKLLREDSFKLNEFMEKFYFIGMSIAVPIVLGGVVLGNEIINLLFGNSFSESIIIFKLLLPLVIIRMITSVFGSVLIMGDGSKKFSIAVCIGACINIGLNIILVPRLSVVGAVIATITCEIIQGIYLYICFKKYCRFSLIKNTLSSLVASILMSYILIKIKFKINIFVVIVVGIVVYAITMIVIYVLKNSIVKRRKYHEKDN